MTSFDLPHLGSKSFLLSMRETTILTAIFCACSLLVSLGTIGWIFRKKSKVLQKHKIPFALLQISNLPTQIVSIIGVASSDGDIISIIKYLFWVGMLSGIVNLAVVIIIIFISELFQVIDERFAFIFEPDFFKDHSETNPQL